MTSKFVNYSNRLPSDHKQTPKTLSSYQS